MKSTNRIIFNTIVLYAKIVICMLISLWTVPLLLEALGEADFGLYNLVFGVVTLLAFINAAMTVSSQRYISVELGSGDNERVNRVYNVSLLLHFIIGIALVVILELCTPFLFGECMGVGPLLKSVTPDRIVAAQWLYQLAILCLFFTVLSVPFDAVMNAYENMLAFSIISIIEAVLKLFVAFALFFALTDRLILYGIGFALVAFVVLVIKWGYVWFRYRNLAIAPKRYFSKALFREMFGFAGWNMFGSMAMAGRNQGMGIVLNLFFTTVLNASYGIANQINNLLNYFSTTLQKSINPQLMMSEGQNDRQRMLKLSYKSSKFSVLIMGTVALPLIMEMQYVLELWLHKVPEYAVVFSQLVLIMSMISQVSAGLMSAIQSAGKIKWYQITMGTLILVNLPVAYLLLRMGFEPSVIFVVMIAVEAVSLVARLLFARVLVELNIGHFVSKVILPLAIVLGASVCAMSLVKVIMDSSFVRLVVVTITDIAVVIGLSWFALFDNEEKEWIAEKVRRRK